MSTSDFPFSVQTQESVIRASLNAGMFLNFLMVLGAYTIVCGGTMYLYKSKRAANANRRIILSMISILYLLCMGDFVIQWYYANSAIVTNGDTRKSIFISTLEGGAAWVFILDDCFYYGVFLVSDMLLIWRCYQVWGMSIRMALVPSVLFLAECGLFIAVIYTAALAGSVANDADAILANNIQSAEVFVSLGTTLTTTFLIGYKIYSSSRSTSSASKGVFNRVVILVVESAAVYSLVILVYGIMLVVPAFGKVGAAAYCAEYYLGPAVTIIGGLAPTVLVARIALTNPNLNRTIAPTVTHISGLQFQHQQGGSQSGTDTQEEGDGSAHQYTSEQDEEKRVQ